jgi:hypothetical protein
MSQIETVHPDGARVVHEKRWNARSVAIVIAMLAVTLHATASSVAFAQDTDALPADSRYRAPIGARQPRLQDLPPRVRRDEGHATASQRSFDKDLQICRDCGGHL